MKIYKDPKSEPEVKTEDVSDISDYVLSIVEIYLSQPELVFRKDQNVKEV